MAVAAASLLQLPTASAATNRLTYTPRESVLLVGDSYTQGVGAVPQTKGYAYQLASALDWNLTIDGYAGSGYVNPTPVGGKTFAERLWKHPANSYGLVIIQGSSNDIKYCTEKTCTDLASAVNMTLRTVEKRYPSAEILLVGPTSPYGSAGIEYVRVNAKLKTYATLHNVPFIDPLAEQWFKPGDGKLMANPENGHPSNAGHALIASRLVADIKALEGRS